MNSIFYKKKYFKYKTKYLGSKKFVDLDGNLVELTNTDFVNNQKNIIKAIAFFNNNGIKGTVIFEELDDSSVKTIVDLEGLEPNSTHGFHVHESGDLTKGCDSMCAHFNPYNKSHGDREDIERHVGDLGNITADQFGKIKVQFIDHMIKLRGDIANIVGRGLIIHADPDDCGKTSHKLSKTTGNSGKRIACAIIGYASKCS